MSQDFEALARQAFDEESQQNLADLETALLQLESDTDGANRQAHAALAFRAVHTLKGSAGIFGMRRLVDVAHALESALDRLRQGRAATAQELDHLLAGVDTLRRLCASEDAVPEEAAALIQQLTADAQLPDDTAKRSSRICGADAAAPADAQPRIWLIGWRQDAAQANAEPSRQPLEALAQLGPCRIQPLRQLGPCAQGSDPGPADDEGPVAGGSGFEAIVQIDALPPDLLQTLRAAGTVHVSAIGHDPFNASAEWNRRGEPECAKSAVMGAWHELGLQPWPTDDDDDPAPGAQRAPDETSQAGHTAVPADDAPTMGAARLPVATAHTAPATAVRAEPPRESEGRGHAWLKVRSAQLDAVIEGMDDAALRLHGLVAASATQDQQALRETLRSAVEANARSRELALGLRMVPVAMLFGRFPRLVRELSRQLNKPVDLLVDDGGAEIDRELVESLADPLLHMLRNAVDHGIEESAVRMAAGKPSRGHVSLSASRDNEVVVIQVRDDGQGLDLTRIRERAVALGILAASDELDADTLTRTVCAPGFSTARAVSEVSGRGVGMDVVKSRIEALRGTLRIRSERGRGSCFELRLPMTNSRLDAYLLSVAGQTFALDAQEVAECVNVPQWPAATHVASSALRIQDEQTPAILLSALLGRSAHPASATDTAGTRRTRRTALVLRTAGRKTALVADAIVSREHLVVRALDPLLAKHPLFNGCAVLGGGGVALLIDPQRLVERLARDASGSRAQRVAVAAQSESLADT
jgi:two-component system chemotaxis sensor kinase CheA